MAPYIIDLDPIHQVLRLTFHKIVTDHVALGAYRALGRLAAQGGPYASITDCSGVEDLKLSVETVRSMALEVPAVPGERPRVAVVNRLIVYGLLRMVESTRTSLVLQYHIVWSVDEA